MRFLVLGATGMAGHTIALYLQEQGHDITAFSSTPFSYCNSIVGDATDTPTFQKMLLDEQYDVVINCIGILNRAAEENPARAVYLNSYLPHLIADTLRGTPTRLFHMSTDCVFSGSRGGYTEACIPDGTTYYDRTKALGEVADGKNLTFRNSVIGPDTNQSGIGLVNWFMRQSGEVEGYQDAIWTGVTTLTLAKAMEQAARDGLTGLYHLVNNQTINKYQLCLLLNHCCKADRLTVHPINHQMEADKSLICTRTDFAFAVPGYRQMVEEMQQWIAAHPALYPHYFN